MTLAKASDRIRILDGFRFLAITSVILYHYYSRWIASKNGVSIYPYGARFDHFRYGYLGVEFFFIISGFVIAYTLQRTNNMPTFWKKRLIRLFPALVICSILTFIICRLFDSDNLFPGSHSAGNLAFSLTFLSPMAIENDLCRWLGIHANYINGSYWSLWPEIQFYVIAAFIYYLNPEKFFKRFAGLALILFVVNVFAQNAYDASNTNYFLSILFKLTTVFNLGLFIPWFLAGVLFQRLHSGHRERSLAVMFGAIVCMLLYSADNFAVQIISLLMLLLFAAFVFSPGWLKVFGNKAFAHIGLISYSLYLIHENVGLVLIHRYAASFGECSFLFPLILTGALITFSSLLYFFVEQPIANYFKTKL
jgi:peptidoglycan/LPS O-acetylase OafA/YrhL